LEGLVSLLFFILFFFFLTIADELHNFVMNLLTDGQAVATLFQPCVSVWTVRGLAVSAPGAVAFVCGGSDGVARVYSNHDSLILGPGMIKVRPALELCLLQEFRRINPFLAPPLIFFICEQDLDDLLASATLPS
jgi:hypothetical protein